MFVGVWVSEFTICVYFSFTVALANIKWYLLRRIVFSDIQFMLIFMCILFGSVRFQTFSYFVWLKDTTVAIDFDTKKFNHLFRYNNVLTESEMLWLLFVFSQVILPFSHIKPAFFNHCCCITVIIFSPEFPIFEIHYFIVFIIRFITFPFSFAFQIGFQKFKMYFFLSYASIKMSYFVFL